MTPFTKGIPLAVPDAPQIAGLVFRSLAGEDDYKRIAAVLNASETANGVRTAANADDVRNTYTHLTNCDLERDFVLVEHLGKAIAYGRCEWAQQEDGEMNYLHLVHVIPAWRRRGIGTSLLRYLQARLAQYAGENPQVGAHNLSTWINGVSPGAVALLTGDGYRPDRYGYGMVRSLAEPLPDAPLPSGIEVRRVDPEHFRLIWEADVEAFRDHPGYVPPTETDYDRWLSDPVIIQPALWQIAWDAERNEIAGQVRTFISADENTKLNRKRGYTEFISTRRPWRRQGLARALLVRSMEILKQQQMEEAALGVDAQNPNGALQLYESVGFQVESRSTRFQRPVDRQPAY
ncbi:MAG: GNAT family N-acetyltransferase [Anaerolineales bacterium]|nr:GNAT family N-acetyltransferase [Anaerolineales bacterium]